MSRITVNSEREHIELLQRMASKGYKRPYYLQLSGQEDQRTNPQNALMWAALTDISRQVEWHGQRLSKDDWKDVLTAALDSQRAVPGIDGGVVFIGKRTSQMSKAQMSDLMELIFSFGAGNGVKFTEHRNFENE